MNIQNKKFIINTSDIILFLKNEYGLARPYARRMPQGVIDFNYAVFSGKQQYVFKMFNTRNSEQVNFELSALQRLARFDFKTPRLVLTKLNKRASTIAGRPCALLRFIPGRTLLRPNLDDMRIIGHMLGELHVRLRKIQQKVRKQTWEPKDIKRYLKMYRGSIIRKRYPKAGAIISFIQKELAGITFPGALPQGFTHQDVKPENIVKDSHGAIHFIDFDACYRGILLYDVMTPIIWTCFTQKSRLRQHYLQSFVSGYQEVRKFEQKEKKHFFDALRFRLLREAFVWPMRFSPRVAQPKSERFMRAYKKLSSHKSFVESLCKI